MKCMREHPGDCAFETALKILHVETRRQTHPMNERASVKFSIFDRFANGVLTTEPFTPLNYFQLTLVSRTLFWELT